MAAEPSELAPTAPPTAWVRPDLESEEPMYVFMLDLHNVLRWVVVLAAAAAIVMAWAGVFSRSQWTKPNANVGRLFTIAFDLQVLVGILLYVWLSPVTTNAFRNMGSVMSDSAQRFFVVEHLLMMVVAAVLVHIGVARGRKTNATLQPAIFYTLALVLVLFAIPWDRSLLPGM